MAMGQGGAKDGFFTPAPHGFVLPYPCSAQHNEENFLTPSPPSRALQSPALPRKTLLLINLPHNYNNFFLIKPISLIKIFLKLQLNLSHQIKLNFSKN